MGKSGRTALFKELPLRQRRSMRLAFLSADLSKGRAIELDAIRGFAIFLAMGWHLIKPTGVAVFDAALSPARLFGWAGVDLFFVLSGFLIGGLILREIDGTKSFRTSRFLIRRAFRLWPVLYLYLIAQLLLTDREWTAFLPQVFFHVQNYFHTPLNQLWSLAVEEQFYFAAALALPFLARRKVGTRSLAFALVAIAVASTALRTAMWFAGEPHINLEWETQYRLDPLLAGILIALVKQRHRELYDRRSRGAFTIVAVIAGIALGVLGAETGKAYRELLGFPLGTVLGASLILASDGADLNRWSSTALRPLAFMGLYSYPIYIWHVGLGRKVEGLATSYTGSVALGLLAAYVAVIAWSVGVTRLVEWPMIQLRNRLFPSSRPSTGEEVRQDVDLTAPRAA